MKVFLRNLVRPKVFYSAFDCPMLFIDKLILIFSENAICTGPRVGEAVQRSLAEFTSHFCMKTCEPHTPCAIYEYAVPYNR